MPPPEHTPPSPQNTLRVLYADDNEILRLVVAHFLTRKGYFVETANDGAEGWQKVIHAASTHGTAYDLVITDVNMPNLDGVGFVRLLRESRQPVKIIVYAGALAASNAEQLRALAVDATVAKEGFADNLVDMVEKVVGACC